MRYVLKYSRSKKYPIGFNQISDVFGHFLGYFYRTKLEKKYDVVLFGTWYTFNKRKEVIKFINEL